MEAPLSLPSPSPPSCRLFYTLSIRRSLFIPPTSAIRGKERSVASGSSDRLQREPHRFFDQAAITIRSGDGGRGAVLSLPKRKDGKGAKGRSGKREGGYSYRKDQRGSLILPVGGQGGDVVVYADEGLDTLLEFHVKRLYTAKRGGSVNAMGMLTPYLEDGVSAPVLRVPVPVGTVVKRKGKGVLADLANHGDEVVIARGGQGGITLLDVKESDERKTDLITSNIFRDRGDKVLVEGQPGEEIYVELILRLVADVALIGLPNAGKSTLLAAITLAHPRIANYPFTTLMPNLGRLDGDPCLGAGEYSSKTTLADMPGLIEGAHLGKGLGRNFLRHLRRTRLLVHVVDVALEDPLRDFKTIREELRMYNPDYLLRPYVVVLNKIDLLEGRDQLSSLARDISSIGCVGGDEIVPGQGNEPRPTNDQDETSSPVCDASQKRRREIDDCPPPLSVVSTSLLNGVNVDRMLSEIRAALRMCGDS